MARKMLTRWYFSSTAHLPWLISANCKPSSGLLWNIAQPLPRVKRKRRKMPTELWCCFDSFHSLLKFLCPMTSSLSRSRLTALEAFHLPSDRRTVPHLWIKIVIWDDLKLHERSLDQLSPPCHFYFLFRVTTSSVMFLSVVHLFLYQTVRYFDDHLFNCSSGWVNEIRSSLEVNSVFLWNRDRFWEHCEFLFVSRITYKSCYHKYWLTEHWRSCVIKSRTRVSIMSKK